MLRYFVNRTQQAALSVAKLATRSPKVMGYQVCASSTRYFSSPTPSLCAEATADSANLRVRWNDTVDVYPLVWLRAHCQCPQCFHPDTRSRRILAKEMQLEPTVNSCSVEDGQVVVRWDDGHESTFDSTWLQQRSFLRPHTDPGHVKRLAWGHAFVPKTFDFASTINDEAVLFGFLQELKIRGLCIVQDAPKDAFEVLNAAVFDYPYKTHYGEYFEVKNKASPSNLAYTSAELGLHNDLPFMQEIPDIQALHCLLQTDDISGGANTFADAAFVAQRMQNEQPDAFKLLSTEKSSFWDIGTDTYGEFHMHRSRPVFKIDSETGELQEVAFNHQVTDSHLNIAVERVKPWFAALAACHVCLLQESVKWRLRTGQVVFFDNRRILHGREGYSSTSARHLRGVYYQWDQVESKLRILHAKVQQAH